MKTASCSSDEVYFTAAIQTQIAQTNSSGNVTINIPLAFILNATDPASSSEWTAFNVVPPGTNMATGFYWCYRPSSGSGLQCTIGDGTVVNFSIGRTANGMGAWSASSGN